jgi:hypothetical protein
MARIAQFRPGKLLLTVSLAVGAAACGDSTGVYTYYYDPSVTLAQLDDILYPIETSDDLLLGLDLAVSTLDYYGSPSLAGAVSLRIEQRNRALRSLRPGKGRLRPRGDRRPGAGPAASITPEPFTLPDPLVGRTLVWDHRDGYVPSRRPGAPAHGVRLILYRMDPETGYPVAPRVEIGYLDITDEDDAAGEGVRVLAVHTTGPARVVADYYTWLDGAGSYEEGELMLQAAGTIGDARVVELSMIHELSWSRSRDHDELLMDYEFQSDGQAVTLQGQATSRYEALEWSDFGFEMGFYGAERVDVEAYVDPAGRLDGVIHSEGYEVVRVRGSEDAPRFEDPDGYGLDWRDQDTLLDLWTRIADLVWYADWLLAPGDLLMASN